MDDIQRFDLSNPPKKRFLFNIKNLLKGGVAAKILIAFIIFLIFSFFAIIFPSIKVYTSAKTTYAQAQVALAALKKQNVTLAGDELTKTKDALTQTQKDLNGMSYLRFVPIAAFYYNDTDHLIKAGFHGLSSASILIEAIKPYSDVLGLKGQGSFVGGTASQRVETAVKTMGKVTPRIDDIAKELTLAKKEIDAVSLSHYPKFFGVSKINESLLKVKKLTDEGVTFINEAKPLIKVLPNLLGEPKEKKYLIIFQNDKELRPTGGFITAYSVFRLSKGIIHVETSSDIYGLDNTISGKSKAPRPILQYLPKVSLLNLRDSNLSPDYVLSMKDFKKLYDKSSGPDVDGIIAVDTQALVAAMNILGDVQADGVNFTTKIDPRCDCPQVIYKLEEIADTPVQADFRYVDVHAVNAARKDIIGNLMYAIMNKAMSSSPKLYWGPLFQTMLAQTSQKHILFYVYDTKAQAGLESLNASGRIIPFEGDYLHINQANFGGAKSNLFVKEDVLQNYETSSDGTITKTVTINYKNPFPPSDCNLERGNLCLNAVLRDWVRIYVPKGSKLTDSQGSEVKVISYDELDKTVFEGFLTVRPKGVAKYTLSYTLPFKLAKTSALPLLIQKQPGTEGNSHTISINGKIQTFPLLTDKTLKLNL